MLDFITIFLYSLKSLFLFFLIKRPNCAADIATVLLFQHPVSDFSISTDIPSETLSRRRHAALSHPDTVICLFVC